MMNTHRTVLAIFATALVIAVIAAFLTTLGMVNTRSASIEAPPGNDRFGSTASAVATGPLPVRIDRLLQRRRVAVQN